MKRVHAYILNKRISISSEAIAIFENISKQGHTKADIRKVKLCLFKLKILDLMQRKLWKR